MRALAHRAAGSIQAGALKLADRAGSVARSVPGVVGAVCVCVGLGQAWHPLFWIAAGGFLLAADRKIT